ncbi:MAG: hypothetical protein A2365_00920, partial [Candidatus Nealsonbacteria bacterium RIFOXYB1_FULL_40_15]
MKKSWELLPKILNGTKTVESRWYKTKRAPWGKIVEGDGVYFQNSGEPVTVRATVAKVDQYKIYDNTHALEVAQKYALSGLGTEVIGEEIKKYITDKKYAIFVHLVKPQKINPFVFDKTGYGM